MSSTASTSRTEAQPGGDPAEVDAELASQVEQLTDHEGVPEPLGETLAALVEQNRQLTERVDELVERNQQLNETVDDLQERVDELEVEQQSNYNIAMSAATKADGNDDRLDDLEYETEKNRELAGHTNKKVERLKSTVQDDEDQPDVEPSHDDFEPFSSMLDFLANCRLEEVKRTYVEEKNRDNTYRTVAIARRWDEFARRTNDGERVFWKREDVETALIAHFGGSTPRQTVSRVWDKLVELGGDDVRERTRQVSPSQEPYDLIEMDIETARALQDERYHQIELKDESVTMASGSGVTPVVTGQAG